MLTAPDPDRARRALGAVREMCERIEAFVREPAAPVSDAFVSGRFLSMSFDAPLEGTLPSQRFADVIAEINGDYLGFCAQELRIRGCTPSDEILAVALAPDECGYRWLLASGKDVFAGEFCVSYLPDALDRGGGYLATVDEFPAPLRERGIFFDTHPDGGDAVMTLLDPAEGTLWLTAGGATELSRLALTPEQYFHAMAACLAMGGWQYLFADPASLRGLLTAERLREYQRCWLQQAERFSRVFPPLAGAIAPGIELARARGRGS